MDEALATADGPIYDRVMALTNGRGADLLIDTVGGPALQDGINALATGGRAIMVGRIAEGEHQVDAFNLLMQRKSLIGCMFGQVLDTPEIGQLVDDLLARVATGELKSVIGDEFPLSRAVDAHRRAEERGRIGRVVMLP